MRALVLSGGGVKGSYQLGVLKKWLLEDKIEYDVFSGVSVGALNSSILAQVPYGHPEEAYHKLAATWEKVDNSKIRKDWNFFGKLATLWKGHVYNTQPLREWVKGDIDEASLAASGKKLLVGTTCLDTGEYRVVRENTPDIWKWVYASSAFPLFFAEERIQDMSWVDGGVRNVTPLGEVIRLGADEIDVILTDNPYQTKTWPSKGRKIWEKATRVLGILMTEITLTDLQVVGLKNDMAQLGAAYRPIKVRLIYPKDSLVDDALDFNPAAVREMIDIGYRDALTVDESLMVPAGLQPKTSSL